MAEAVLTPLEAIKTATLNASRYFGKVSVIGTVGEVNHT